MVRRISSSSSAVIPASNSDLQIADAAPPIPPRARGPAAPGEASPSAGALSRFGGPLALPIGELAVGAWFAVAQARHLVDVVAPGPAQLWRAGGHGGAIWHGLAALVGAAAAVHGLVGLLKLARKP